MVTIALNKDISKCIKQADKKEDAFRYALTGKCLHTHDSIPYTQGGDVLDYAVKTSHASLPSNLLGDSISDKVDYMFANDKANKYVYISNNYIAYIMQPQQFKAFVLAFGRLERDSKKNGGNIKVRLLRESNKMLAWLNTQA